MTSGGRGRGRTCLARKLAGSYKKTKLRGEGRNKSNERRRQSGSVRGSSPKADGAKEKSFHTWRG